MKSLLILTMLFSSTLLTAQANAEGVVSEHNHHVTTEEQSASIDGMSLNGKQKWEMDEHTRLAFKEMAELFLSIDINLLKTDALKEQGAMLQGKLDNLIQGCTMEGEPHEQLHTFLMEYMPQVAELSNTGSVKSAEKIKYYLETYSKYFK